jgi:hypothetical protein
MKPRNPGKAEHLAALIAVGETIQDAAHTAGVPLRTAKRWVGTPKFKKRVGTLRRRMIDCVVGKMSDHASAAVKVLIDIMSSIEARNADRISAARGLLSDLLSYGQRQDIDERITALEQRLPATNGHVPRGSK